MTRLVSDNLDRLAGIKVVYTDMDGTMLGARGSFFGGPKGEPTLEPAQALLAARAAGIDVVPCSGRALRGLQTDARLLGLGTTIAEMGALLSYDFGHDVVRNFGETPARAMLGGETPGGEMPARAMERCGAVAMLIEHYAGKLEHHTPWSAWRECTQLFRGLVDTREADALLAREGHDWLTMHDNGRLPAGYLGLEPGTARAYHLQPKGVSKGTAVALDRARRGFAREECLSIGDAFADLELATETGVLVIVGDALVDDPALTRAIEGLDNVLVTDRAQNLGWADTLLEAAARA